MNVVHITCVAVLRLFSDLFSSLSVFCSPSVHLQVNSDKIYWQRNVNGTFTQIYSEKKTVGHYISTKAVGSDERNDITDLYKYSEGIPKQNSHTEINTDSKPPLKGIYSI